MNMHIHTHTLEHYRDTSTPETQQIIVIKMVCHALCSWCTCTCDSNCDRLEWTQLHTLAMDINYVPVRDQRANDRDKNVCHAGQKCANSQLNLHMCRSYMGQYLYVHFHAFGGCRIFEHIKSVLSCACRACTFTPGNTWIMTLRTKRDDIGRQRAFLGAAVLVLSFGCGCSNGQKTGNADAVATSSSTVAVTAVPQSLLTAAPAAPDGM